MQRIISGIQQIGIGVTDAREAFDWYKTYLGFDTIIFEDKAPASLMTRYTGGEVHQRYAVLAMNMQGGAGFEIWQYTSRQPQRAKQEHSLGDTGIFAVKIRCKDVEKTYGQFSRKGLNLVSSVVKNPAGILHFYVTDPYGNIFDIIEDGYWFIKNKYMTGGVCGVTMGVSNIEASVRFYQNVLGYNVLAFDQKNVFKDFVRLKNGSSKIRRVLLKHRSPLAGPFSRLLGPSTIELVQNTESLPHKIYADRYWGDVGFIHICYDVCGMKDHASICAMAGHALTVNSEESFAMEKAAGHFAYNEDPDGTLIEYVETHKVPILKKIGWYLDLRKRDQIKPLPDWMVRCMSLGNKSLQLSD